MRDNNYSEFPPASRLAVRIFLTGQLAYGLQPQARKRSLIGTQAAFEAIAATMAFGSVNYDAAINAKGERLVWLEPRVIERLRHLRGPGESYSDVIIGRAAGRTRVTERVLTRRSARLSIPASVSVLCSTRRG